uniref:5'-3' exoribonuclease 1 n=1 Tax=Cacopsylla melanoneura TaxID=428564 RepID=A0A8D8T5E3_9HEMI
MGVPKFFRYMSERYPCLSEVVREYQIPEFDNLYLDMNGIIHNCSHPNDNDPHFRITEKQIFQDIFHYLEILFRMIQPKKLFFMAIDGVAPRAKMNQQRGRRFRSAKEAEVLEQKAREKGEQLPTEKRFDSNCITPGTPFMCRLHQQLRYFIKLKMSTDKLWKDTTVILSGHETPGEGEHKIMDYIRFIKSKPDFTPNLRHCLYGLDADLIMLGLCTHEPYFCLLREEVKFNTKSNKGGSQIVTPEETKFFLLHLSLMRDYLELEFSKLKQPGILPFPFNIEKIIDDWVLMGFLIGNDFIPNLPDIHIINGALPLLYKVYMEVLPTMDGYINEDGLLNLKRFEKFMTKLASFDFEQFREKYADLQYLETKTGKKFSDVFYKEKEKKMDADLAALIKATDDDYDCNDGTEEVLNYADYEEYYYSDEDEEWRQNFFTEFGQHKTEYYHYKLDYAKVTNDVLRDQAECYIRAIQWNLHYYYNGCVSWSWYYPHHYAPYISDIKDFSHLTLKFEMGEPFLPFQQLLAVLPAASKELLPEPYQDLMTLEISPILEYYPEEFQTDLNGKKQDWEAVVLIPFIDEKRLIKAMDEVDHRLTDEERSRNRHGPMLVYTFSNEHLGRASAPEYFPLILENHAMEKHMYRDDIYVHPSKLKKGLCNNVNMNLYQTQFHTLKHVKFTHKLDNAKVKVFQQPSRNESIILELEKTPPPDLKKVADQILGKTIYINYPHLVEIRVQAVSLKDYRISFDKNSGFVYEKGSKDLHDRFNLSKKSITDDYFTKLGVNIGNTDILVYGQPVEGKKYFYGAHGKVTQQKTYIRTTNTYAYQTAVFNIQQVRDSLEFKTIDQIFYNGCQCFNLSNPHYGSEGDVISTVKDENSYIKLSLKVQQEPDLRDLVGLQDAPIHSYLPSYTVATKLSISPLLLSRFTGSIFILEGPEDGAKRHNIGLNIKFSRKNEEVVGFTRRDENSKKWFYTDKVITLIKAYMKQFPEVFDFLKDHSSDDIYLRDEVFPNQGAQRVAQIVNWLKEQPHAKAEVRPCGAAVVDEKVVGLIEHALDSCEKVEKRMTLLVRPNKLYMPKPTLDKICPDPDTKFELFDRVVNIRDCYTVPLGYRGTVIGIIQGETVYDTMYDVVFDKPFPHGVKIRCSEGRGYRMAAQAMINLSHGERLCGNNNPYPKNLNVRSRVERNGQTSYAQTTRQAPSQETYRPFYKENTPVKPYLQVISPHHVTMSRSHSQQSSVSQSPNSTAISQHSSPFNVKPKPVTNNINEIVVNSVTKDNQTKTLDQTKKDESKEQKVVINKEQRCIFSNATPALATTQSSELFLTGGLSFFGCQAANPLDMPENKNKQFNGEKNEKYLLSKENQEEIKDDGKNSVPRTSESLSYPIVDTKSISKERESLDNGFIIPSITDLIKQNNITANRDYPTTGQLQNKTSSNQQPTAEMNNLISSSSLNTRFTTKLTNMFNKNRANDTETENTFKRAISAMVQQSPQLLEKQEEQNSAPPELSFQEKHAPPKKKSESLPMIKTEMRQVIPSSEYQNMDEEEEEVMIIEINKEDSQESTEQPSADPFQQFLMKLKSSKQPQEIKKSVETASMTSVDKVENTNSSSDVNIHTVTADTINEFFAEASRRQGLSEHKPIPSDTTHVAPSESSVDASDLLKKMLNINLSSARSPTSPLEQLEATKLQQEYSSTATHEQIEQKIKPVSAFTVVKSSATPTENNASKAIPKNVLLESLKSKPHQQALNPCVASFIPPQVQKQHIDKIKPLETQMFQPSSEHFAHKPFVEEKQLIPGQSLPGLIRPQPGHMQVQPITTDLNSYQQQGPSSNMLPPQARGIPILGSQAAIYNQSTVPYQQHHHHQQQQQQQHRSLFLVETNYMSSKLY